MYQFLKALVCGLFQWFRMAKSRSKTPFPPAEHDHAICVSTARLRADEAFKTSGLRMTPLRACVLEEISASHRAMGAYEILDQLALKGQRMAPISVYRALDALLEAGVVHRLESRNAFFACQQPHASQRPYLVLICSGCGRVAETPAPRVWSAIDEAVQAVEFAFEGSLVEVSGRCEPCGR
jgi:Fur family transcriptional regulator, zinc uptake regulator